MTDKNPIDLLEEASNELKSQQIIDSLENFHNILGNVKKLMDIILQTPSLISVYIYQLLRFYQQINYSLILIKLEQGNDKQLMQIIIADINFILKQLMQGTFEIGEICGREFLRFFLDGSFFSEISFSVDIKNLFKPGKNEFVKTLIPNDIQKEIDESLVGKDTSQVLNNLKELISKRCPETIHFLICDIIRYVFSAKRLPIETKTEFIVSILKFIPNWSEFIYTFEICIVLFIDLISYQRGSKHNEDDSNIRVCFNLIKKFPIFLNFVENLVKTNQILLLNLAEAATKCNERKLFENVTLPTVEPEEPQVDTKEALNTLMSKLKWHRKSDGGSSFINDFTSQVIHNLQPCFFEIPFKPSQDLQMILDTKNPQIISSICERDQNVLKMSLFNISNNSELVQKVIENLSKSEVANPFLLQSFSKVLVLSPNLLPFVTPVLPLIAKNADTSPFIRFMSYNLTNEEIFSVLNSSPTLLPSDEQALESLLKNSLSWKETAQNVFWMLIVTFYINRDQTITKNFFNILEKMVTQFANFPIVFTNLKQMLMKMQPSPILSRVADAMMKGNEKTQNGFVTIVSTWFRTSKDETIVFLQNRLKSFKSFYLQLNEENKKRIPESLKQSLQNGK